jgi:hypothetical protein
MILAMGSPLLRERIRTRKRAPKRPFEVLPIVSHLSAAS